MDWFVITLICAFSLAVSDAMAKKHLGNYSTWQMLIIRFTIPGILLIPILFFYPLSEVPSEFWLWLIVLMPLELIAMAFYMVANFFGHKYFTFKA